MAFLSIAMGGYTFAQNTPPAQMEHLDRGLIVLPAKNSGNFISWRMLGTDDDGRTTFDILRNGTTLQSNVYATNYTDASGSKSSAYQIVTKVSGVPTDTTAVATSWGNGFLTLPIERPANGTGSCTYTPNDCSVGDVDGDGQYELFLKWDPSNSRDNSQTGVTGNVYIDCYKMATNGNTLDGESTSKLLWRIDLGPNIRAGAHYSQFMVYDFDDDGKAELMVKTAPGSKDGAGNYVNQAATDETIRGHSNTSSFRNSNGHITSGAEYLTVFNGLTGQAIHTTWYLPSRAGAGGDNETGSDLGKVGSYPGSSFWGDNTYNRSERYLAAVAHIHGAEQPACGIFCRGYYTRAYVWAVSFDGTRLHTEWLHASPSATQSVVFAPTDPNLSYAKYTVDGEELQRKGLKTAPKNTGNVSSSDALPDPDNGRSGITGSNTLYANGNHNLSVADVDGDGCDEIIWGSAALDNDGTLLYATGMGHGDAIHMSDLVPDRAGLEVFDIHEERVRQGSWDVHDAATGEIIYIGGTGAPNGVDNGRGMSADISSDFRGFEFWSYDDNTPRRGDNGKYASQMSSQSSNFRLYWNGDLYDELLDGHYARNSNNEFDHVDQVNITTANNSRIQQWTDRSLCNTTKMTPNLSADILGDWREELVLWDYKDPTKLYIHSTNIESLYRMPTLMHDHTYRMGVAWQNTAYNQPPHLGYFLPDAMLPQLIGEETVNATVGEPVEAEWATRNTIMATLAGRQLPGGGLAREFSMTYDYNQNTIKLTGTPTMSGDYTIRFRLTSSANDMVTVTVIVHVTETDAIDGVKESANSGTAVVYDLHGRIVSSASGQKASNKGVYIIRQNDRIYKTTQP